MFAKGSRPCPILSCFFHLALVAGLSVLCIPVPARAQSVWQQLKEQAKKTKEQMKQAAHPNQGPQAGQPNAQPAAPGARPSQGNGPDATGPVHPPQGTKVEETVMAPLAQGAKFFVSPHGVHVATVESSGSRAVVYYDGVPGPNFDEILGGSGNSPGEVQMVFSPDGKRYAYCGRSGGEMVVMVDGKELLRSSDSWLGAFNGASCQLGFTSNSQHVFFSSNVARSLSTGESYTRFVFDGKQASPSRAGVRSNGEVGGIHPAFSPDGNHYAYVAIDPADEHKWALVIDGKIAPYRGGGLQWSADSQHLYTTIEHPGPAGYMEAMLDGKPFIRADHLTLYVAPAGNMVVALVDGAIRTPTPVQFLVVDGKKVPGSEIVHQRGAQIDQVTFSPDGKHYAARYSTSQGRQYIFVDGKRAQEYQSIDHILFTSDSSKVTYTAFSNGKPYAIFGDQESDACLAELTAPVIDPHGALVTAPTGGRAGTICGLTGGPATVFIDGKTIPLPGGARGADDLRFSPDGQHFAYSAGFQGGGQRLVVDGVVQTNSNLATSSNPGGRYVFSPDSQHIAVYSLPPTPSGEYATGLFLDGKNIPIPTASSFFKLGFTADSKHIAWAQPIPGPQRVFRIFVDGKPVADAEQAIDNSSPEAWWDMASDGSLAVLAQDQNNLKRITITPSPETSLATLAGRGTMLAKREK